MFFQKVVQVDKPIRLYVSKIISREYHFRSPYKNVVDIKFRRKKRVVKRVYGNCKIHEQGNVPTIDLTYIYVKFMKNLRHIGTRGINN